MHLVRPVDKVKQVVPREVLAEPAHDVVHLCDVGRVRKHGVCVCGFVEVEGGGRAKLVEEKDPVRVAEEAVIAVWESAKLLIVVEARVIKAAQSTGAEDVCMAHDKKKGRTEGARNKDE